MVNSTCSSALEAVIIISLSYAMVTKEEEMDKKALKGFKRI
jgi:hypothetical protein